MTFLELAFYLIYIPMALTIFIMTITSRNDWDEGDRWFSDNFGDTWYKAIFWSSIWPVSFLILFIHWHMIGKHEWEVIDREQCERLLGYYPPDRIRAERNRKKLK